jgi:hypothetical protein
MASRKKGQRMLSLPSRAATKNRNPRTKTTAVEGKYRPRTVCSRLADAEGLLLADLLQTSRGLAVSLIVSKLARVTGFCSALKMPLIP